MKNKEQLRQIKDNDQKHIQTQKNKDKLIIIKTKKKNNKDKSRKTSKNN